MKGLCEFHITGVILQEILKDVNLNTLKRHVIGVWSIGKMNLVSYMGAGWASIAAILTSAMQALVILGGVGYPFTLPCSGTYCA